MHIDDTARRARAGWILLLLLGVVGWASSASGQLTPDRLYYGKGRSIPMTVALPEGGEGSTTIRLMSADDASVIASADVPAGAVDLAGLFPRLWTTEDPTLLHAQLFSGETPVGPSVVLQPLLTPDYARLVDMNSGQLALDPRRPDGTPRDVLFTERLIELRARRGLTVPRPYAPVYSGLRAYVNKDVVMETTEGPIRFRLRPDEAPNTCWTFRHLVDGGFYTEIDFHRVVRNFVIQAGDPNGLGSGGPGFMFDLEPSELKHDFGVLSMARAADPNTNGSQFFICLSREATSGLDGRYTAFGEAIEGAEAIMAIATTPLPANSQSPTDPPQIISARLVDAQPWGQGGQRVTKPEAPAQGR